MARPCFAFRQRCLAVLLAGVCAALPAIAQPLPQNELKAQILLRALLFVDWPPASLSPGQALALCVVDSGPLADALERLAGKNINQHRLEVRRTSAEQLRACHAAYRGSESLSRVNTLPAGVLLVGDSHGLTERGVMLNLLLDQGHVVFDVDLASVRRAGLDISAKLLRLARFVRND